MKESNTKKIKHPFEERTTRIKEMKDSLLTLAIKSNDEINKNKILKQMIEFNKNELNRIKEYLSLFSSLKKSSNLYFKKDVENELFNYNKILINYKELMKKEIDVLKGNYELNSAILQGNINNQKNILETLKETNFILENKIKEKESIINRIKDMLFDIILKINNYDEINKDIEPGAFMNLKEYNKIIDYNLKINEEYYQGYLIYKSIQFNKIKNKINKLSEKKKELENIINNNQKSQNINNINNNIYNSFNEDIKFNLSKDNFNNSNDITFAKNITNENSIFSINDSLYFDTEEQIDIELPKNDFSSYYSCQKNTGLNIIRKKIIIPPLNLDQIKYNTNKNKNESSCGEMSLSRSLEKYMPHKIKNIKNQIESYKRQNINLEKKCRKYEKKIRQIGLLLNSN